MCDGNGPRKWQKRGYHVLDMQKYPFLLMEHLAREEETDNKSQRTTREQHFKPFSSLGRESYDCIQAATQYMGRAKSILIVGFEQLSVKSRRATSKNSDHLGIWKIQSVKYSVT